MEKELEDWYENYFEMFGTAGWKQLEKTFSELYDFKNSVPNLKDASDATINGGGFGAFYFESDHGLSNAQTITETKSGTALAIGTSNGEISFNKVSTKEDAPPYIPVTSTE